jgi:HSP20 family protein
MQARSVHDVAGHPLGVDEGGRAMEKETGTQTPKSQELGKARPARTLTPLEEMDRMFEGLFSHRWPSPTRWEWPAWGELAATREGRMPKVDMIDREAEILVRAELPGVDKKDLDVTMTDNTVTIRASTKHEEKEEDGDYYRCEISRGAFLRTLALPGEVDGDKAKAAFKDGILELTIPKVEKARKRSVKVE